MQVERFGKLQPQHGAQFTVSGSVWTAGEGPRAALECHRLPEAAAVRCVNDEELLRRRFDLAADPHHWRESGVAQGFDRIPQHCYLHLFHLDWHRNIWVHAQHVQEYRYQPGLRERLVLPQAHRDLIDILTADRSFRWRTWCPASRAAPPSCARARPALGKTLTAEVYAEVVGKPLYRVHSGQLGVTASSVGDQPHAHPAARRALGLRRCCSTRPTSTSGAATTTCSTTPSWPSSCARWSTSAACCS